MKLILSMEIIMPTPENVFLQQALSAQLSLLWVNNQYKFSFYNIFLLVYWNPDGGLLIEYHYPYSTMRNLILQIKLKLLCNPDEDDITLLTPTIDVTYTEWYLTFDLLAESAYGKIFFVIVRLIMSSMLSLVNK